jgi:acylphosphatase
VGFRFTAQRLARGFDVAGYVRNLPDGRVELVAEGDSAEIDGFLEVVRDELDHYIRDVTVESCPPPPGPFTGFTIRY